MIRYAPLQRPPDMAIVAGFLRFGDHMRKRGIPASTGRMLDLLRAIEWLDLHTPDDLFLASRSLLVDRVEDLPVFEAAFLEFWRKGTENNDSERPMHAMPVVLKNPAGEEGTQLPSLQELIEPDARPVPDKSVPKEKRPSEMGQGAGAGILSWTGDELLRQKDFGAMTPEELRQCKKLLAQMQWKLAQRRSRRLVRAPKGRYIDWRGSYRRNVGYGGVLLELERLHTKTVKRPLIVLADVSGSMDRYTRPVLQLVHTMRAGHGRVEAFVFGTRLTRVTRQLHGRDPDAALQRISEAVADWAGGTRIGESVNKFNRGWARRVLNRGAVVIILSDGWDRGDPQKLSQSMRQLQRRCHRLIWLNPSLGTPTPRPVPLGMQAAMPFIDDLLPARNMNDLLEVGRLLASLSSARPERRGAMAVAQSGLGA